MGKVEDIIKQFMNEKNVVDASEWIKFNEGYNPNIYKDIKTIPTTGYGFNITEKHVQALLPKDVLRAERALTQPESDEIFTKLYDIAKKDAINYVGGQKVFNKLSPNQQTVLTDMSYQMGYPSLSGFENMREAIQTGDMKRAVVEMLDSDYATKDTPERAKRNAELFMR